MQHNEKLLKESIDFDGRVFKVLGCEVELEDGRTARREIVHHTGGAAVIALDDEGCVQLVRQYRFAFKGELLEIPAGRIERGEAPREAAVRELREEAGVLAATVYDLGEFFPTVGYCDEIIYLFAAKGLTNTAQDLDADEFISPVRMPLDELVAKITAGEVRDGKTIVAALKLKMLVDSGQF